METSSLSLILLCLSTPAFGGHVLVFPGEYSHWLNARAIVDELLRRNHSVTVLVPDASPSVKYNSGEAAKYNFLVYKVERRHDQLTLTCNSMIVDVNDLSFSMRLIVVFQVPYGREEFHQVTEDLIHYSMYEYHTASYLQRLWKIHTWTQKSLGYILQQCESMLRNKQLMATLEDAAFDAVLLDPVSICGDLVADVLGLPLILSLRFSFGGVLERHCGHVPAPPSFVPPPPLPYSDRMTFTERLVSVVTHVSTSVYVELAWRWSLGNFYSEIKGGSSSVSCLL